MLRSMVTQGQVYLYAPGLSSWCRMLLAFSFPGGLLSSGVLLFADWSPRRASRSGVIRKMTGFSGKRLGGVAVLPALTFLLLTGCGRSRPEPPSLLVMVVVDQLRGDLLETYDSLFTGGFRRLHDEGLRFSGATHDHGKTATAPGHTTLGTGVFPARNGIVNNSWLERTPDGWRSVYCFEDTLAHILGHPSMEGRSPRNNLREGLADWILDADSEAVFASISRKDRAAIGMAGQARGQVYWIAQNEGRFVTSSYYTDSYPVWVDRFNREAMPRIMGDSVWEQTLSPAQRSLTRRDTVPYEGDGEHTFFPHRFGEESSDPDGPRALNRWAYSQMHPDAAVAAFAQEAVRSLGMGGDEVTDFLALSFSQADAIGHDYGPFSREQLENLLHLDRALGQLMTFLDDTVGEGRWLLAFSGDHGVMTMPEYLTELGEEGRRPTEEELSRLRQTFEEYRGREGDPMEVAEALVAELEAMPILADAATAAELLSSGPPADSFSVYLRNSYHPDRWHWGYGSQGTGVVFRFIPALYADPEPRGTGHGSPYFYDRHVPLIFFGPGVERGLSEAPARTVDLVPTLAFLAGIPVPDDLDGRPLLEGG